MGACILFHNQMSTFFIKNLEIESHEQLIGKLCIAERFLSNTYEFHPWFVSFTSCMLFPIQNHKWLGLVYNPTSGILSSSISILQCFNKNQMLP